ncbi:sulfoxide reductase heme-binding subunit YedZ [Flavobacterium sp. 7E]|uniref:ferric reductase-like transmembrane domain-containing protein n=1 Tax=Flavobacterium sp. 7E TaxID=2735898 RepID=UPI0020C5EED6|nr:ferric reductase-like transmembrane domain-containing protein [Flavobacterium sp. 7E]NRS90136.1 sulfoxide reductase heme-binding subunit YedZ [Flavobacterium sp. 7E]
MIVALIGVLPIIPLLNLITLDFSNGFSISLLEGTAGEGKSSLEMLYHISGEFAIRWMTAVLSCTPFFILFGVNNLFVRQAMGIAAAVWSFVHYIIFIAAEGFAQTFTEANYIAGFIAVLILIPLFFTSNRKAMKKLKKNWKKIQTYAYGAIILSLLHIILLEKTWLIYGIIVGLGFIIRLPLVKNKIMAFRNTRN